MSKYNALWEYVKEKGTSSFQLTFEEIQNIVGIPIDHSFLKYKKELTAYGYQVGKISMKDRCGKLCDPTLLVYAPEPAVFAVSHAAGQQMLTCPQTLPYNL